MYSPLSKKSELEKRGLSRADTRYSALGKDPDEGTVYDPWLGKRVSKDKAGIPDLVEHRYVDTGAAEAMGRDFSQRGRHARDRATLAGEQQAGVAQDLRAAALARQPSAVAPAMQSGVARAQAQQMSLANSVRGGGLAAQRQANVTGQTLGQNMGLQSQAMQAQEAAQQRQMQLQALRGAAQMAGQGRQMDAQQGAVAQQGALAGAQLGQTAEAQNLEAAMALYRLRKGLAAEKRQMGMAMAGSVLQAAGVAVGGAMGGGGGQAPSGGYMGGGGFNSQGLYTNPGF